MLRQTKAKTFRRTSVRQSKAKTPRQSKAKTPRQSKAKTPRQSKAKTFRRTSVRQSKAKIPRQSKAKNLRQSKAKIPRQSKAKPSHRTSTFKLNRYCGHNNHKAIPLNQADRTAFIEKFQVLVPNPDELDILLRQIIEAEETVDFSVYFNKLRNISENFLKTTQTTLKSPSHRLQMLKKMLLTLNKVENFEYKYWTLKDILIGELIDLQMHNKKVVLEDAHVERLREELYKQKKILNQKCKNKWFFQEKCKKIENHARSLQKNLKIRLKQQYNADNDYNHNFATLVSVYNNCENFKNKIKNPIS